MAMDLAPSLIMVLVQFAFAGMNILSKLAMNSGMDPFIHVAYRQIFASVIIFPLGYFIERGKRPPMTMSIFIHIFFCSLGLSANQITYFLGLKNSTPTISCALANLLPALTFVLAVIFKQESPKLKTLGGQAKLMGTLAAVGGAMLLSLYQGPAIPIGDLGIQLKIVTSNTNDPNGVGHVNVIGPILNIISTFTWAVWLIIHAKLCNKYPAVYSSSALMLIMSTVECCIFGLIMEPHSREWMLVPTIRAISSVYAGVVCSGIGVCMTSWCNRRKGPLFVSVFNPLLLVIVAILSWALLHEKLYLGKVLGSLLIVMGLYCVLWGKSKEIELQPYKIGIQETKNDNEVP